MDGMLFATSILLVTAMLRNVMLVCWRDAVIVSAVREHGTLARGVLPQL